MHEAKCTSHILLSTRFCCAPNMVAATRAWQVGCQITSASAFLICGVKKHTSVSVMLYFDLLRLKFSIDVYVRILG